MRIAIPTWEKIVSPVFDTAQALNIITCYKEKEIERREIGLLRPSIANRTATLVSRGVDIVICGAISKPFAKLILSRGITLYPWISGNIDDVLQAFFENRLSDMVYSMPGCRRYEQNDLQMGKRERKKTQNRKRRRDNFGSA